MNWSFFENVYCINLKNETLRYNHALKQFNQINLNHVKFYQPDRDPISGVIGCWKSHQFVCSQALAAGANFVLVFEDDVIFDLTRISQDIINRIIEFITSHDFDVFYLGHAPYCSQQTGLPGIIHTKSWFTHAYIASRSGMEKIANAVIVKGPIDGTLFCKLNNYAISPMFANQNQRDFQSSVNSDAASQRGHKYVAADPKWMDMQERFALFFGKIPILRTKLIMKMILYIAQVYFVIYRDFFKKLLKSSPKEL